MNIDIEKYNEDYLRKYLDPSKLEEGLRRLKSGEPVQYIVGNVDFFEFNYDIDSRVLIPRFETEELVDRTIKYINKYYDGLVKIVDLGTGSGCIANTLSLKLDNSIVSAIDISTDALDVAKHNSKKYNTDVKFINNDMLDGITDKFDVIISNPPYISIDEQIMDVVKNNEPSLALYASNNGLYFYDKILSTCKKNLNDNFFIAFEIGQTQALAIIELTNKYLSNVDVWSEKDLNGLDRYIFIKSK